MLSVVEIWDIPPSKKLHIRSEPSMVYRGMHLLFIEGEYGGRYGDAYSDNDSEEDKQMLLDLVHAKWGSS